MLDCWILTWYILCLLCNLGTIFLPPISLERILQVQFGEDKKSRSSDCFFVLATSNLHRFDHVVHVIWCHFHIAFCLIKKIKLESFVAGQFFQMFVSYLMYFFWFISLLCFDELFLHVVENISLTHSKFSCSPFMIDSRAAISCSRQFFQMFVSYLMYLFWFISLLCFDELFLHVVENISMTHSKFSCSLFMIDSCFSHVMTPCTILGSPKVCIFL